MIAQAGAAEELSWQDGEALLSGGGSASVVPPAQAPAGPMRWSDIAEVLGDPGPGHGPASPASLAEQLRSLSEDLARFDGPADATGALPFADLRNGTAFVTARHPLLSSGYETGTGAGSAPITPLDGMPLSLEIAHVERSELTLAASRYQLGAQIEDRSFTQVIAGLGEAESASKLSLVLARSELVRRQSAGYASSDPYGYYSYGSSASQIFANSPGKLDASGLALELSLFSDKAVVKTGFARSLFSGLESPLATLGFDDPLAEVRAPSEAGDARFLDLSLTPWQTPEGLLQLKLRQSESDAEFGGSAGWDYAKAGAERSISAEGRWKGLSVRADTRESQDANSDSLVDQSSLRASMTLNWLDLSLSRRLHESASEYTYLSYVYGQDPEDYYAGAWVPVRISNVRSSDSKDASARLHGEAWSVDLDWNRAEGLYRFGSGSQSAQDSEDFEATASYDFGPVGLQAALSKSDQLYGVEPDPVVSSRTEGGLTLSFDLDRSGHRYGAPATDRYGASQGGYGRGYGGPSGSYPDAGSLAAEFPWLAPGLLVPPLATSPDDPGTQPRGSRAAIAPEPAPFLSRLLPSTARIGVRRGVATEDAGDDGLDGLPPMFSNELSAPQGPYYALEGGLGWVGDAGSRTDLSLRVTLAGGDKKRFAAGGVSYQAALSHNVRHGPWGLGGSLDGTFSRFEQPSEVQTELYATASVHASYSLQWVSFDARAYGVHQETRYSDGSEPYASSHGSLQLGAQMTLDSLLPTSWMKAEAPPYLRLRGFYDLNYSATAFDTLQTAGGGVVLFGGFRF